MNYEYLLNEYKNNKNQSFIKEGIICFKTGNFASSLEIILQLICNELKLHIDTLFFMHDERNNDDEFNNLYSIYHSCKSLENINNIEIVKCCEATNCITSEIAVKLRSLIDIQFEYLYCNGTISLDNVEEAFNIMNIILKNDRKKYGTHIIDYILKELKRLTFDDDNYCFSRILKVIEQVHKKAYLYFLKYILQEIRRYEKDERYNLYTKNLLRAIIIISDESCTVTMKEEIFRVLLNSTSILNLKYIIDSRPNLFIEKCRSKYTELVNSTD